MAWMVQTSNGMGGCGCCDGGAPVLECQVKSGIGTATGPWCGYLNPADGKLYSVRTTPCGELSADKTKDVECSTGVAREIRTIITTHSVADSTAEVVRKDVIDGVCIETVETPGKCTENVHEGPLMNNGAFYSVPEGKWIYWCPNTTAYFDKVDWAVSLDAPVFSEEAEGEDLVALKARVLSEIAGKSWAGGGCVAGSSVPTDDSSYAASTVQWRVSHFGSLSGYLQVWFELVTTDLTKPSTEPPIVEDFGSYLWRGAAFGTPIYSDWAVIAVPPDNTTVQIRIKAWSFVP